MRTCFFLLLFAFVGSSFSVPSGKDRIVVVIDPGHGGSDPGHLSNNPSLLAEKDINLKIAQFLGSYLKKYLYNVDILFTREDDRFPTLDERVDLANGKGVDYFLSIHCNGSTNNKVFGTESHVHDFAFKKSVALATAIEKEFSTRAGRTSRGVKNNDDRSHSIQVLKYTKMTSVLVECGFITHANEAKFLNTTHGQELIASAIFRALRTRMQADFPEVNILDATGRGYEIQLMSSKEPLSTNQKAFTRLGKEVQRIELNTKNAYKYKYVIRDLGSAQEAEKVLAQVKKQGFPDALLHQVD